MVVAVVVFASIPALICPFLIGGNLGGAAGGALAGVPGVLIGVILGTATILCLRVSVGYVIAGRLAVATIARYDAYMCSSRPALNQAPVTLRCRSAQLWR